MVEVSLKRLVSRKGVASILQGIAGMAGSSFSVKDEGGRLLLGDPEAEDSLSCPVEVEGQVLGWTRGEAAPLMASLLSHLAILEVERKALGRETLEKYKEINLLYDITEKLAACLDTREICLLVIEEAGRQIKADRISVLLLEEETGELVRVATSGEENALWQSWKIGEGIAGCVALTGKAEIVNDVSADDRYVEMAGRARSKICAPLKMKDRILGVIDISSEGEADYSAADLKLLSALAFQAAAVIENAKLYERLKETFLTTVDTLADTIDKRDPYTGGHTKRVMQYSLAIAGVLNFSEQDKERLKLAALLHDIGKIGVRDDILLKDRELTPKEFEAIKMHVAFGEEIVSHIKHLRDIVPGVKKHHERYDGLGYPDGLQGREIDLIARIISVADTYDAMTTDRPYRKGLSAEVAKEELRKKAGTQFDPQVVEAFLVSYSVSSC